MGDGVGSRSTVATGPKFRVDGRVASTWRVDGKVASTAAVAAGGSAVSGPPVLAAAVKDLRYRLREAELEVKGLRAERLSVERLDRRVSSIFFSRR